MKTRPLLDPRDVGRPNLVIICIIHYLAATWVISVKDGKASTNLGRYWQRPAGICSHTIRAGLQWCPFPQILRVLYLDSIDLGEEHPSLHLPGHGSGSGLKCSEVFLRAQVGRHEGRGVLRSQVTAAWCETRQLASLGPVPSTCRVFHQARSTICCGSLSPQVRTWFDLFWVILRNIFIKAEQGSRTANSSRKVWALGSLRAASLVTWSTWLLPWVWGLCLLGVLASE